jgi:hypothetical protein
MSFKLHHYDVPLVEVPSAEFEEIKKGLERVSAVPVFFKVTTLGYRVWPLPADNSFARVIDDTGRIWTIDLEGWMKPRD